MVIQMDGYETRDAFLVDGTQREIIPMVMTWATIRMGIQGDWFPDDPQPLAGS